MRLERNKIGGFHSQCSGNYQSFQARDKDLTYFSKIAWTVVWEMYWKGTKMEAMRPVRSCKVMDTCTKHIYLSH